MPPVNPIALLPVGLLFDKGVFRRPVQKGRFRRDISHELRTPVAAIRGHAELALRGGEEMSAPVRHSLTRIDAESQRMGVIVEDLLLLARLTLEGRWPVRTST